MAVANVKDLWELAVTLMGGNAAAEIIDSNTDMSAPSSPFELTLDQVYTQIRRSSIDEAGWLFAKKHAELVRGPDAQFNGAELEYDVHDRWEYTYRVPSDCLKFLGFTVDQPDLQIVARHRVLRLPINYVSRTSGSPSFGVYTFSTDFPLGTVVYQGSGTCDFVDASNAPHRLRDFVRAGTYTYNFAWGSWPNGYADSGSINGWDYQGTASSHTLSLTSIGGQDPSIDITSFPTSLTVELGLLAANDSEWTEHIACDVPDAIGVYVADVTDPSRWPSQFQMYVASQLAYQLAIVHSKSSKQIELSRQLVMESRTLAITDLAQDEGTLSFADAPSTSQRARW